MRTASLKTAVIHVLLGIGVLGLALPPTGADSLDAANRIVTLKTDEPVVQVIPSILRNAPSPPSTQPRTTQPKDFEFQLIRLEPDARSFAKLGNGKLLLLSDHHLTLVNAAGETLLRSPSLNSARETMGTEIWVVEHRSMALALVKPILFGEDHSWYKILAWDYSTGALLWQQTYPKTFGKAALTQMANHLVVLTGEYQVQSIDLIDTSNGNLLSSHSVNAVSKSRDSTDNLDNHFSIAGNRVLHHSNSWLDDKKLNRFKITSFDPFTGELKEALSFEADGYLSEIALSKDERYLVVDFTGSAEDSHPEWPLFKLFDLKSQRLITELPYVPVGTRIGLELHYPYLSFLRHDPEKSIIDFVVLNLDSGQETMFHVPGGARLNKTEFDVASSAYLVMDDQQALYRLKMPVQGGNGTDPAKKTLEANLVLPNSNGNVNMIQGGPQEGLYLVAVSESNDPDNERTWLWDGIQQKVLRTIGKGQPRALSQNKKLVALQLNEEVFSLNSLETGKEQTRFSTSSQHPFKPAFSADSSELWYAYGDIVVYNTLSNKLAKRIASPVRWNNTVKTTKYGKGHSCNLLLPDTAQVALCRSDEKAMEIVDVYTGKVFASVPLSATARRILPFVKGFVVLDEQRNLTVADLDGNIKSTFNSALEKVDDVAVHYSSGRIALVQRNAGIRVYGVDGALMAKHDKPDYQQTGMTWDYVSFDEYGNVLTGGYNNPDVETLPIDSPPGKDMVRIGPKNRPVIAFDLNGDLLSLKVGSIARNYTAFWDLRTGQETTRIQNMYWVQGDDNGLYYHAGESYPPQPFARYDFASRTTDFAQDIAFYDKQYALFDQQNPLSIFSTRFDDRQVLFRGLDHERNQAVGLIKHKDKMLWVAFRADSLKIESIRELKNLPHLDMSLRPLGLDFALYNRGRLSILHDNRLIQFDVDQDKVLWNNEISSHLYSSVTHIDSRLRLSADQQHLLMTLDGSGEKVFLVDADTGETKLLFSNESIFVNPFDTETTHWNLVSSREKDIKLALRPHGDIEIYSLQGEQPDRILRGHAKKPEYTTLSDDGTKLLSSSQSRTLLWDLQNPDAPPVTLAKASQFRQARILKRHIWALDHEGRLMVFNHQGRQQAEIVSFDNDNWMVADPAGRYDSNTPGDIKGAAWVLSDEPFTAYPIELFLKQNYEPRLLARVLNDAKLPQKQNLEDVNRVRPSVEIATIAENPIGTLDITVVVTAGAMSTHPSANSDAYDLRLFRDGKQIRVLPENHGKLDLDGKGKRTVTFTDIQLPNKQQGDVVQFSAMAFNNDGVKSDTAVRDYQTKHTINARKPRVFVINVGIDRYQNSAWNLSYAVNDAKLLAEVISAALKDRDAYSRIVQHSLYADDKGFVSKSDFEALMGKLRNGKEGQSPVTPDDTIILSWSGHGYADENGIFHLITSENGESTGKSITPQALSNSVSSDDFSRLFEPLDAANILIIIDACNSAASVEGKDFKPGPMGSHGFGQLAWFKGMQILTASQADDVAMESNRLQHGLLTYALGKEGLEAQAADYQPKDHMIVSGEWLRYAQQRVPQLYTALIRGTLSDTLVHAKGQVLTLGVAKAEIKPQIPGLFDFIKGKKELVISGHNGD